MINKNIAKPLNIASGKINLTDFSKLIIKNIILKRILLLKKILSGLFGNINLLRKLGYKKIANLN